MRFQRNPALNTFPFLYHIQDTAELSFARAYFGGDLRPDPALIYWVRDLSSNSGAFPWSSPEFYLESFASAIPDMAFRIKAKKGLGKLFAVGLNRNIFSEEVYDSILLPYWETLGNPVIIQGIELDVTDSPDALKEPSLLEYTSHGHMPKEKYRAYPASP